MPVTPAAGRAKIRRVVNSRLARATQDHVSKHEQRKATQVSSTLYVVGHMRIEPRFAEGTD